jgi:uncharacterized protein (TIRG00374 family)
MAKNNFRMRGSDSRARRWLWTSVEIIILLVVALIIVRHLPGIQRHLQQVSLIEALVAAALLFIGYVLYAVRWQRLLIHKPGYLVAFQAANVGQMINMWIPTRLGIVARSIILNRRESIPTAEVPGSVVVERWLELVLQVTALSSALVLGADLGLPLPLVISMMLLILGLLVALLLGGVKHRHKVVETWPPRLARLPRLTEE